MCAVHAQEQRGGTRGVLNVSSLVHEKTAVWNILREHEKEKQETITTRTTNKNRLCSRYVPHQVCSCFWSLVSFGFIVFLLCSPYVPHANTNNNRRVCGTYRNTQHKGNKKNAHQRTQTTATPGCDLVCSLALVFDASFHS